MCVSFALLEIKGVSCVYVIKCIRENMMMLKNISRVRGRKVTGYKGSERDKCENDL